MTTTTVTIKPTDYAAGFDFALERDWIDTYGARWTWTGETDSTGMALMQTGDDTPQTLNHVYWWFGPLAPAPRPVTHADRLAAVTPPVCAAASGDGQEQPKPTPLTFARIANRLRLRGRSA